MNSKADISSEKVIKIENLYKSFGDFHLFKGLSTYLKRGENLAVMGKSGTGKSVLAKCIVGLNLPDQGEIYVLDQNIIEADEDQMDDIRQKIGYLFQGGALYDSMSVRENLEFPVRRTTKKENPQEINGLIEEALENVGLIDAIDKMPSELSGGMKKRIGLARTLILSPEIIIYDEPTTGLDPVTGGEISELILSIQEKYKTSSIIITHDLKCVELTSNRIILLSDGTISADGTFEELRNSEKQNVRNFFN
jgi:phospholipid/cholesterol/gamma-HCH transport system ATP-binding protein